MQIVLEREAENINDGKSQAEAGREASLKKLFAAR